ncbi:MAG TPA: NAD(P)H-quinone oxidoreductase [Pyrinomonadaceae bacterium]|nr:NAD(P)H-quinone oxidoreductase [Pyrinomonadaceae bacterium]
MRAVYITTFGGPENLEIREVPDPPTPTDKQVLVRVKAAGLNRADLIQRRGNYPPPPGYSPNIPGLELAGEVAETGDTVSGFKKGDRVFGIVAGEAQAEFVLTDERVIAKIPDDLSFVGAAAVPEVFITAHDAVFTQAALKKGETILIHAVGSGVGLAGLQLAKAAGATVIGTSRAEDKLEKCGNFGLDEGIVTATPPEFADIVKEKTDGRGVDVILDLVGAAYFQQNLESLALKGRLVLVGLTAGSTAEFNLGIALYKRLKIIGTALRARSLEEKAEATRRFAQDVVPLLANGAVRPNLDKVFPVRDIRAAHEYLESNESFGKVVLEF